MGESVNNATCESQSCYFEPIIDIFFSYCRHDRIPSISEQIRDESFSVSFGNCATQQVSGHQYNMLGTNTSVPNWDTNPEDICVAL
jgi:hypothetical protein